MTTMRGVLVALLVAGLGTAAAVEASKVRIFRLQSQEAFRDGTFDGVSVDSMGVLRLAAAAERVTAIEEPFVLSAAEHPEGWVVGTGNSGRVILVRPDGETEELMTAAEPEVFAVWADPDGTVYAGTSPNGRVYRVVGDEVEVFFEPEAQYIWQLGARDDGTLLVATGTEGRLYEVDASGESRVLWDADDTHVRAFTVLDDGAVIAGTAGEGLIARIGSSGRVQMLYDAEAPEVVAFAPGPGGVTFAAIVASEASQLPSTSTEGNEDGSVVVVVEEGPADGIGSRPAGYDGPRSEILRISPSGTTESVAGLQDDTVYALAFLGRRLWIGTGLDGKLYTLAGNDLVLENDVDERQIVALMPDNGHPAFATTNAGAFYRMRDETERTGTYTSSVLDAGQIAEFGLFRWLGDEADGSVEFSFRTGVSREPDLTWSDWTEPMAGRELGLAALPSGRYVQWRAEMSGREGDAPEVVGVDLSYRQHNLPPRIRSLEVLPPGALIVSVNFNPSKSVFEPAHPTRDGIFTTLEPGTGNDDARTKNLWKRGFQTLRWTADDPNEDELVHRLEVRPLGSDRDWIPVVEELDEAYYAFDATVVPDGFYRFRLVTEDRRDGRGLVAERITEPVVIDHGPPRLIELDRRGENLVVTVADNLNPLREARYSVDGDGWESAEPADGLLDGRTEVLEIPAPPSGSFLILQVTDAAFNTVTFDLSSDES